MLHIINNINDPFIDLIQDDPVRPNISAFDRLGSNKEVLVSLDSNNQPLAVVCVSYQHQVPHDIEDLFYEGVEPNIAIFYTIWSYSKGAGRDMIFLARDHITANWPNVQRFVTLSPTTEMARKFHLANGANIFRVNDNSVNYEYA